MFCVSVPLQTKYLSITGLDQNEKVEANQEVEVTCTLSRVKPQVRREFVTKYAVWTLVAC